MITSFISDRVKMYNDEYMSPFKGPKELQRKVQFDVRLYFARRGAENMHTMTKDTFKLEYNMRTESWYVVKQVDEMTKNHKTIDEKVSGFMPENKDDPLCPVKSFRKYIEHLHPENEYLWQKAKETITTRDDVWYTRQHIGKNTLQKFMNEVSDNCKLSKTYTNHSIRVTGVTVLTRQNFAACDIMSITGHKSVQSLTRYQKTQPKRKIEMGNVMHQSLTRKEDEIVVPGRHQIEGNILQALPPPEPRHATGQLQPIINDKENVCDVVIPYHPQFDDDEVADFDLMQIMNNLESPTKPENTAVAPAVVPTTTSSMTSNNVLNNIPKSLFHNCTIQNITFNMPK